MPNTFKNAKWIVTNSMSDVYTCPSTNTKGNVDAAVVILLQATNVSNRADNLTIVWTDASNGNAVTNLCAQTPIPAQQSVGCLTGKLVLEAGDKIRAQSGNNNTIHISVSVLETS